VQSDLDLDERLKRFWLHEKEQSQIDQIITSALAHPPATMKRAARSLQVMEQFESQLSDALRERIEEFRGHVSRLGRRRTQVDLIGSAETEADAAVFEVLGEATEGAEPAEFDASALRQARAGAASRADGAVQLLHKFGLENIREPDLGEILAAAEDIRAEQAHYKAQALFVDASGDGFVLGLVVKRTTSGTWLTPSQIDPQMMKQAQVALKQGMPQGVEWDIEWPFPFEGESIGLGLYLAALVIANELPPDGLCAATGKLEVDGQVRGVSGIEAKLEAARRHGIRRVVLPSENREEAQAAGADLELIFVDRVSELKPRLLQSSSGKTELGFDGRVRLARSLLRLFGLELFGEKPLVNGRRLEVADAGSTATIDVLRGKGATVVVGGDKKGTAYQAAEKLVAEHLRPPKPETRETRTYQIKSAERRERARQLLLEAGAIEQEAKQYEEWRLRLESGASSTSIVQYTSGKCVLQGSAPA
jgi:hypothetical protein